MDDKKDSFMQRIRDELESMQDLLLDTSGMSESELNDFWRNHLKRRIRTPCNEETLLLAFCLEYQQEIPEIAGYPLVIKYEYELEPGRSDKGKGDLVLSDGKENYLVVEAKYIDHTKTGRNQGNKRTKKRRKVEKQVEENLLETRSAYPEKEVQGFVLTNETIPVKLSEKFEEYRQQKELSWKK